MKEKLDALFKHETLYYFIKWSILASIIGVVAGFVGFAFGMTIKEVTKVWHTYPLIKIFVPIVAIFIVFFYKLLGSYNARGTNLVIESISTGENISPKLVPLMYISSSLSHLVGASVGREGAALQLGAGTGSILAKLLHSNEKDRKLIVMCGMAACFSGLFGTPITAAIFCIEIFSVGILYMSALVPCMFAAFVGAGLSNFLGLKAEIFPVTQTMPWNIRTFFLIIALAAISAVVARFFCKAIHIISDFYKKYIHNSYIRAFISSIVFFVACTILGTDIYNGAGMNLVDLAMKGELNNVAFLIKIILTSLAIAAGLKGGEIVPTFAIGASLGFTISKLLGIPLEVAVSTSLVAFFVGVTNCPIASIFLAIELFHTDNIYITVLAVAVSFLLSGYYSLYASQKFAYKKTSLEFLGKTAHSLMEE